MSRFTHVPTFSARSRTRARTRFATLAIVVSSLGCASYPVRTQAALRDFERGQLSQAVDAFKDPKTTGSAFLSGAEAGMVALAAGEWDLAIEFLNRAVDAVDDVERSALISPESLGETLTTLVLTESVKRYEGEGYERVMLHAGLAMAYLAKGDLTGAQVEVRRADSLLESEETLYEKQYEAGGLGHLLSAIAYELDGKSDEAYIDYKRMVEKGVGTELAGRALVRLATKLHFEEDLREWKQRFGEDFDRPESSANVVVIAGIGLGPYKRENAIYIPTPDGLLQWAVPSYVDRPQPIRHLELSVKGGDRSVRTIAIEDVGKVARENLDDRIAWLAARSAVRAVLKRELSKKLEKEIGPFGQLLGDVFTFVSERADLRAWQTLPDTWQAARVFLSPGVHELTLAMSDGERQTLGTFELEAGETMFVFARTVGTNLYAHPVGGRRVTSDTSAVGSNAPDPTVQVQPTP